jgi:hypothetical protein
MDFDYKKYSLENLENWMHDALSCSEATPQEIYDVIKNVVSENYYIYKDHTERCYELLALLNGNGVGHIQSDDKVDDGMRPWGHSDLEYQIANQDKILSCNKDDPSPECQKSWTNFWEDSPYPLYVSEDGDVWIPDSVTKEDKIVKWQLPVQVDGLTGDCFVEFPDDLLEVANLKEGDTVEWIDKNDGSFELRKVNGTK